MAVTPHFNLNKRAALQILREVERIISTWYIRGRELGMNATELEQFVDAFEHQERRVVQAILGQKGVS
jgi:hypothetical protein